MRRRRVSVIPKLSSISDNVDDKDDEEIYEVEAIIGHKGNGKSRRYHIKWAKYDEWTWEPASNLNPEDVKEYEATLPAPVRTHSAHARTCRHLLTTSLNVCTGAQASC